MSVGFGGGILTALSEVIDLGRLRVAREWRNKPPLHLSSESYADTPVPVCTPMRMHAAQACPVKHAAADGTEYPRFSSLDSGPVSSSLSLPLPFSRPVPFSLRVQVVPQTPSTVNASNPRDIKPCDTDGAAVCIGNPHLSSPVSYSHLSHPLCLISSCAEYGLRRTSVK